MAKNSDVNVEIATSDGLVRYSISAGDLSKVPEEHRALVASALGADQEPTAAPVADPEPTEATETSDPAGEPDTTERTAKRGKE